MVFAGLVKRIVLQPVLGCVGRNYSKSTQITSLKNKYSDSLISLMSKKCTVNTSVLEPKKLKFTTDFMLNQTNIKQIINPCLIIPTSVPTARKVTIIDESKLPSVSEKIIEDFNRNIIEKYAIRMIVIRRRKMRIHKLKKLRKRMKFVNRKKRLAKKNRNEKEFQAELLAKVKEAEAFDPASYVSNVISRAKWEKPIVHIHKAWCPESVIKEYLKQEQLNKTMYKRALDCIRLKERKSQK